MVLADAARDGGKTANEQLCSANYFVGMAHVLKGDGSAARNFFAKALASNAADLNEYDLTRAELERLTGKYPPPADLRKKAGN